MQSEGSLQNNTRFDFAIFVALFSLTLLFELQLLIPELATFRVRHVLIGYLYASQLVRARSWYGRLPPLLSAFIFAAVAVAVHSAWRYDLNLAVAGGARFMNVAILAPLAAVLVTNGRRLRLLILVWCAVVAIGYATTLYQLAGGRMDWLVGDYYSGRGEAGQLLRYKSMLGDPNVGGMAAAVVAVAAVSCLRGVLRMAVLVIATSSVVLSLSKAAAALLIIGLVLSVLARVRAGERRIVAFGRAISVFGVIALVVVVALVVNETLRSYLTTLVASVVGTPGYGTDVSVLDALVDRLVSRTTSGFELAAAEMGSPWLAAVFGAGYGIAGSVATELRGTAAILPHNGYLEAFLVGGVPTLAILVVIVITASRSLFTSLREAPSLQTFCLITLVLLSLTQFGFPVIYDPILGALFWLLAGVTMHTGTFEPWRDEHLAGR